MSGASNNHLKTEKPSKSKFSAVKINNVYRGTSTHSAPYNPINKHGLFQSVGKIVPSRRIPPPTNLPSLKSENCGNDPYVNLVPTGGQGWGTKDHCISDTPVPAAHVSLKNPAAATAAAASGGGSQNAAAPVAAAASSKPAVSTPSAAGYSAQSAGAGAATSSSAASATPRSVSGEKSWSSIMSSDATTAPPPPPSAPSGAVATGSSALSSLKSAHFHQEFPQLKTDATGSQRPAPATTASVAKAAVTSSVSAASSSGLLSSNMKRTVAGVPSLRPNTSGSWSHGGGGLFDQPAAATAGPVFGTAAAGGSSADHRVPPALQGPAGPSVLAAGGTSTATLLNKSGTAAAPGSQTAPFQSIVPYFMMSSAGAAATTCSITSTSAKSLARAAQTGGGHSASNSNRSATGFRAQQRPVMTGSSTPIVKSEDLQQLDHITDKYNSAWVGPDTDVDYNKKLSFSDGEDECVESGGNRKGSSSALRRADAVRNNNQSSRPPTDRPFGRAASGGEHLVATGRQSTRPLLSPSAQHKGVMSSAHMRSVPAGQSTYMSMTSGTSLARHRPAQHEEDTWRKRQQQQDEVSAAMQRSRQLRSRVDDAATDRYYQQQQQQQAQLAGKTGSVHSAVRSQRAHTSASASAAGLWTDRDRTATSLHDRNARRYTGAARDNGGGGAGGGYMMSRYSTAEDAGARRNNRSDDVLFESSVAQRNTTGATHNDTRSDSNGGGGGGTNGYYDVEYYDYGTSWADQLENEARPPAKRDVKQRESEATVSAGDSGERRSRGRSTSSSMGDDSVGGGKQGGATGDASSSANDTLLSGTPTLLTRASASAVTDGLQREVCEGMVSLKPSQPASNRAARSSSTSTDVKSDAEAAAGRNYSSGKSAAEKSGASSQNQSSDATALPAAAATETAPPKNVWLARKETSRAQQETTCGDKTRANYPVVGEHQRGDSTDTAQSQRHAAGDGGSSDNQPDMTAAYERRHDKRPAIRGQWSQRHDEAVDRRARGYHSDYQAARRDKRQHYQQPWEEEYERYDNRTRSEYYGSSGRAADDSGVRHTSSTTGSSGWQQSAPRWRTQTQQQQHRELMGADPQAPHEPQEAESSAGGSGGGGWGVERRVVNDARRSSAGEYDAGTTTVTARRDRRVGYETSEDHVSNRRDQRKDQRDDRRLAGTRDKTGSGRVDSRRGEHVDARNDRHAAEPSHADTRLGGAGERRAHDGRTGGRGGRGRDKEQRTAAPTDTADNNNGGGRKRETERPEDQVQQHQGDKLWDNTDRSYRQQPGDRRADQRSTRRGKGDASDRQQQQGGGESRDNRRRGGAWRDEADDHQHVATRRSDQQNSRRGDTRRDRSGAAAATRNERSKRHAVPPASSSGAGAGSHDVPEEHHSRNADGEAGRPRWQLHADPDYRGSSASYRGSRREFRSQRALTGASGGGAETRPRDTRSGMAGGGRRSAGTRHEPLETHSFSGGGGGRRHATPAEDPHAAKSSIPPLVPNTPSCSAHRDSTLDSGSRKQAATCDVTTAPQQQQQTSLLDEHRHHCQARSPSDHTIEDGDWETASEGSHGAAACSVSSASRRHRRPSADTQPQLVDALTDKVPSKQSGASSTTAVTEKPSVSTANTGARTRPGGKGAADCFKELDLNSGGVVVVDEHPQVTDDTDTVDDAEFREVMRRRTPRERQKGGAEEQGHKKREERGGRRGPSDKNSTAAGSSRSATNTRHERKSNNSQNTGSALTSNNNNNNNAKSQHQQRVSNRDRQQQQQQSAVIASSGGAGVGSATCPVDGAVTSAAGGTAELRVENELLPRAPVVNAWDKPITAALRSVVAPAVSSAASSSVAASSSHQQLQQRPLSCADPAAPILYRPSMTGAALSYDAAGVPSKTIIFENTNFRGASAAVAGCGGKLSGGVNLAAERAAALAVCSSSCASSLDNNTTPVASAAVLDKQRATAAPSSAAIQLPHMFSSEHVRHMKLDFTFDSSELTGAMTSSASTEETGAGMTSAAVTAAMISSGSADLNMKIASVKRVWDTPSVSPLPDAAAAVSSSCLHERQLSPSSVVAKETATVAVAAGGSVVGWSDAAGDSLQSFNVVAGGAGACKSPVDVASSMSSNNVCKVKPQQQQQQGSLTAPLQPPVPLTATRIHHLHQQPPQQSHMTAAEHPACCTCRQCLHGGMVEPSAAVVSMAVPLPDTIYQPGITSSITSPVSQVHLSAITSPASSTFLLGSAPGAPTVSQAIAAAYQPFQLDQHPPPVAPPPPPPATVHRQYSQFPYAGSFGLMQTPPPTLGSVPAVSAADLSAALRHYPPSASSSPGSVAVAAAASMLGLKPCGPPPPIPSQPAGGKTAGGGASYQQQKLQFIQYDPALMGSHVRVNSQLLQQRQPPPVTPPSSVFNGGQGAAAAAFFQQGGSVQQTGGQLASYGIQQPGGYAAGIGLGMQQLRLTAAAALPWNSEVAAPPAIMSASRPPPPTAAATLRAAASSAGGVFRPPPLTAVAAGGVVVGGTSGPAPPLPPPQQQRYQTPIQRPTPSPHLSSAEQAKLRQAALQSAQNFFSRNSPSEHAANINNNANNLKAPSTSAMRASLCHAGSVGNASSSENSDNAVTCSPVVQQQCGGGEEPASSTTTAAASCTSDHAAVNAPPAPSTCAPSPTAVVTTCDVVVSNDVSSSTTNTSPSSAVTDNHAPAGSRIHAAASGQTWTSESAGSGNNADDNSTSANSDTAVNDPPNRH